MSDAYRSQQPKLVLPDRCEVRVRELPEASRAWLLDVARADRDPRRATVDVGSTPILAIVAGLASIGLAVAMVEGLDLSTFAFTRASPWSGAERWMVSMACAAAAGLLAWGIAALRGERRSILGSFWYAHGAYLLSCEDDKVTAFPLARLGAHEVLGTNVELSFGVVDVCVPFESAGEAQRFAAYVTRDAAAAKQLAGEDAPDAIPGADLIPHKLLARGGSAPGGRRIAVPIAAAAIAAVAGRSALPAAHAARSESRLAAACRADPRDCETDLDSSPADARRDARAR